MCRLLSRDPAKNKSSRRPPIRLATLACEHHILNTIIGVPHPYPTEDDRSGYYRYASGRARAQVDLQRPPSGGCGLLGDLKE